MSNKVTIINNPHTDTVLSAIKAVSTVCLLIAILGSSVMYYSTISTFLIDNGFTMDWGLKACTLTVAIVFSGFVGFYGIKYCVSYFLYALHMSRNSKIVDGEPTLSPILKYISFICACCFIFLEGNASLNGADIIADNFVPKTQSLTSVLSEAEILKQNALAPLKAKVLDIEAKIEEEAKNKSNPKLNELANKKDAWALKELSKFKDEAAYKYRKEYKAAKETLAQASKDWEAKTKQIAKVDGQIVENNVKASEKRKTAVIMILRYLCFASLILSLILMIAITAADVSEILPAPTEEEVLEMAKKRKVGFFQKTASMFKGMKPTQKHRTQSRRSNSMTIDLEEAPARMGKSLF